MNKTLQDLVPKVCMAMMVNALKEFISDELLACLYRDAGKDNLMEESAVESERRNELLKTCDQSDVTLFFALQSWLPSCLHFITLDFLT